jgi:hypothetical protein
VTISIRIDQIGDPDRDRDRDRIEIEIEIGSILRKISFDPKISDYRVHHVYFEFSLR